MSHAEPRVPARARYALPALVLLLLMTFASSASASGLLDSAAPLPSDGVWNRALEAHSPLDATSPVRVAALVRDIDAKAARGTGPWPGVGSSTFYTVGAHARLRPVALDTGAWGAALARVLHEGVPIPRGARPGAGSDGHMVIYQPSTHRMWELYQAHMGPDGWHASWGGAMHDLSRSPGYYNDRSWPGLSRGVGTSWGATATSLPEGQGLIRISELRAGVIRHALAVDVAEPCRRVFAWPAQRTDGQDSSMRSCMPEGARLRIDPRVDLSRLHLSRVGRILATAAQRYGMIVRDRTGGTFQFDMEQPGGTTNPYTGAHGLFQGRPPWTVLAGFPWHALKLMRMRTCTAAPCAA